MKIPSQSLDLTRKVEKQVSNHTYKLAAIAFSKLFPNQELIKDKIQVDYEKVENYSCPIYTIRYDGTLLLRRYINDMNGLRFNFESPIFNNLK